MTGVDPSTKYENPRQDVGGFLLSKLFKLGLDGHPECELESLQDQSDSDGLVPSFVGFSR